MIGIAELTQHIPEKGEHLVRYYGWYSHRRRGLRVNERQAEPSETAAVPIDRSALAAEKADGGGPRAGSVSSWARLIKRVYEVDPLVCAKCGGQMKIISFIERGQRDVVEQILRHCGLWEGPIRTLATARGPPTGAEQASDESPELQLVLDPEYL